jgi:hypothetical protein
MDERPCKHFGSRILATISKWAACGKHLRGIASGFSMNTMHCGITTNRIFFELSTGSNGKVRGFWKSESARAPMRSNSFNVGRTGPDWI